LGDEKMIEDDITYTQVDMMSKALEKRCLICDGEFKILGNPEYGLICTECGAEYRPLSTGMGLRVDVKEKEMPFICNASGLSRLYGKGLERFMKIARARREWKGILLNL
jgi:hypothetical protein